MHDGIVVREREGVLPALPQGVWVPRERARGIEAVNFRILYKIVLYWILTVPAAALTSMIVFKLLELIM